MGESIVPNSLPSHLLPPQSRSSAVCNSAPLKRASRPGDAPCPSRPAGPSGAGKSTLLNALACRLDKGATMEGKARLNGQSYSLAHLKRLASYVMQVWRARSAGPLCRSLWSSPAAAACPHGQLPSVDNGVERPRHWQQSSARVAWMNPTCALALQPAPLPPPPHTAGCRTTC